MPNFKTGDTVLCVDDSFMDAILDGRQYAVEKVHTSFGQDYVTLVGINGDFYESRFELVPQVTEVPTLEIDVSLEDRIRSKKDVNDNLIKRIMEVSDELDDMRIEHSNREADIYYMEAQLEEENTPPPAEFYINDRVEYNGVTGTVSGFGAEGGTLINFDVPVGHTYKQASHVYFPLYFLIAGSFKHIAEEEHV